MLSSLSYNCSDDIYTRSLADHRPSRIKTYSTLTSKNKDVWWNNDCPISRLTLCPMIQEGEIMWTVDLSNHLVKSIYVKIDNLFGHSMTSTHVMFGAKKWIIPQEAGEISIKKPLSGNYLEVRAKLQASDICYKNVDVENPNLVIFVEIY